MAAGDDIKNILTNLLKVGSTVESTKKSLEQMGSISITPDMDPKTAENILKLKKNMEALAKATEEYNKIQDEKNTIDASTVEGQQKLAEANARQMAELKKKDAAERKNVETLTIINTKEKERVRSTEEATQKIIENWKQGTIQGKVYTSLTGSLMKFTAGLTAGAMAMKLLNRVSDAAKARNDIMISSFQDLSDSIPTAAASLWDYEAAARSAQATAIELGMANENTTDMMVRYAKVVGTDSPKALGALTEATLAMAKVMNITGSEAMAYVQARMDNFGGSAAAALQHLDELRETTVAYNKALGGTKVRADDVLKVIQDITNSNTVYAADQRFLSQIMMRTSSTLQAQGESYNYASRMAENYTKALTSEAPEWMQITNAFDIAKVVKGNLDKAGKLLPEFAKKLDASKPGLSKKVQELLSAGYSEYDVTRLLGDTLKGTDLAMNLMSEKIAKLGAGAGGISRLAAVYGKTHQEAEEMYKSALKTQAIEKVGAQFRSEDAKQRKIGRDALKQTLGISDELLNDAAENTSLQETLIRQYGEKKALLEAENAAMETRNHHAEIYARTTEEIEKAEEGLNRTKDALAAAEKGGNEAEIDKARSEMQYYSDTIKRLQEDKDAAYAQVTGEREGDQSILGALTAKTKKFMEATSIFTGNAFYALLEKASAPVVLGLGAVALIIGRGFGAQKRMEGLLEQIARNTAMKGYGGGGGGGFGGGGRGGKSNRRQRRYEASKGIKSKGVGGMRGMWGKTKGLFGKSGSFLKGASRSAMGLGKGLLKKVPGLGLASTLMDSGTAFAMGDSKGATKSLIGGGGAAIGTLIGGALGSIVPGAGTMIGGALGGMAGEAIANMISDKVMNYDDVDSARKKLDVAPQLVQPVQGTSQNTAGVMALGTAVGQAGQTLDPNGSVTVTLPFMQWLAQGMQKGNTGPFGG
jgi:hypothetical protein